MSVVGESTGLTAGQLASNGMAVQGLQKLLAGSETNLEALAKVLSGIEESQAWRAFTFHKCPGEVFRWRASEFRNFIQAKRPAGCQTPLHILEQLLRGTSAWEAFLRLTRGKRGGANNPDGVNQYTGREVNRDNITVDQPEAPTGTSNSYALRRLSRERPDLYERVKDRELSAHAAMVEAGFRDPSITIPADPRKAARRLVKHFSREQFSQMVDEALRYYQKG